MPTLYMCSTSPGGQRSYPSLLMSICVTKAHGSFQGNERLSVPFICIQLQVVCKYDIYPYVLRSKDVDIQKYRYYQHKMRIQEGMY